MVCGEAAAGALVAPDPSSAAAMPLAAAIANLPEKPNIDAATEAASSSADFSGDGDEGFAPVSIDADSGGAGCAEVTGGLAITGE